MLSFTVIISDGDIDKSLSVVELKSETTLYRYFSVYYDNQLLGIIKKDGVCQFTIESGSIPPAWTDVICRELSHQDT